jgi:hypothetical protein
MVKDHLQGECRIGIGAGKKCPIYTPLFKIICLPGGILLLFRFGEWGIGMVIK